MAHMSPKGSVKASVISDLINEYIDHEVMKKGFGEVFGNPQLCKATS